MPLMLRIQLTQIATTLASDAKDRAQSLEPERIQIEARLKQIEAIAASAKFANKRVRDFQPEIGGKLQCPRCWVLHETKMNLTGRRPDTKDDLFTCEKCGLDVADFSN